MLFDVHCHLNHEDFQPDWEDVARRAREAGVRGIINVGWDLPSSRAAIDLAQRRDDFWAVVGVHPHDASGVGESLESELVQLARHPKVVAIGEVGLDYHYDYSPRPLQREVFRRQLAVANELELPVVIHSRDAAADTMSILDELKPRRCLLHCFGGSWETAQWGLSRGYYFSFGGPVTFKNAKRPVEVVSKLPQDRLMVETDAPYLAPEPNRGKRNEPAFVVDTLRRIALLRGIPSSELARALGKNTLSFFNIRLEE
jgi:TatD DNase family protein